VEQINNTAMEIDEPFTQAHLFADAWRSVFLVNLPAGIVTGAE
jgi:hypothetical protein